MKLVWTSLVIALTQGRQGEEESLMQSGKLWAVDTVGALDLEQDGVQAVTSRCHWSKMRKNMYIGGCSKNCARFVDLGAAKAACNAEQSCGGVTLEHGAAGRGKDEQWELRSGPRLAATPSGKGENSFVCLKRKNMKKKFTVQNLCIHAAGDKSATFRLPGDMKVRKLIFTHKSGGLTCRGGSHRSNFGCDRDSLGLVITEKDKKKVLMPLSTQKIKGFGRMPQKHAHWYKLQGVGEKSLQMKWKFGKRPVLGDGKYELWYNEDLSGGTEGDNAGTACYDVEILGSVAKKMSMKKLNMKLKKINNKRKAIRTAMKVKKLRGSQKKAMMKALRKWNKKINHQLRWLSKKRRAMRRAMRRAKGSRRKALRKNLRKLNRKFSKLRSQKTAMKKALIRMRLNRKINKSNKKMKDMREAMKKLKGAQEAAMRKAIKKLTRKLMKFRRHRKALRNSSAMRKINRKIRATWKAMRKARKNIKGDQQQLVMKKLKDELNNLKIKRKALRTRRRQALKKLNMWILKMDNKRKAMRIAMKKLTGPEKKATKKVRRKLNKKLIILRYRRLAMRRAAARRSLNRQLSRLNKKRRAIRRAIRRAKGSRKKSLRNKLRKLNRKFLNLVNRRNAMRRAEARRRLNKRYNRHINKIRAIRRAMRKAKGSRKKALRHALRKLNRKLNNLRNRRNAMRRAAARRRLNRQLSRLSKKRRAIRRAIRRAKGSRKKALRNKLRKLNKKFNKFRNKLNAMRIQKRIIKVRVTRRVTRKALKKALTKRNQKRASRKAKAMKRLKQKLIRLQKKLKAMRTCPKATVATAAKKVVVTNVKAVQNNYKCEGDKTSETEAFSAYWEYHSCGHFGNDYNSGLCKGGKCPKFWKGTKGGVIQFPKQAESKYAGISQRVNCKKAKLVHMVKSKAYRTGKIYKNGKVNIADGIQFKDANCGKCSYLWHAQYECIERR